MNDNLEDKFSGLCKLLEQKEETEFRETYKEIEKRYISDKDFAEFLVKLLNKCIGFEVVEFTGILLKKIAGLTTNSAYDVFLDFFEFGNIGRLNEDAMLDIQDYLKKVNSKKLSGERNSKIGKIRKEISKKLKTLRKFQKNDISVSKSPKKTMKTTPQQNIKDFTFNQIMDYAKKKYDTLAEKIKSLESSLDENKKNINNFEIEKNELQRRLDEANKSIQEFKRKIDDQSQKIKQLSNNLEKAEEDNKKLREDNNDYEQANKYLQDDKAVLREKYIESLSAAIQSCYNDYKKIMADTDIALWKTVTENIFSVLKTNKIKIEE